MPLAETDVDRVFKVKEPLHLAGVIRGSGESEAFAYAWLFQLWHSAYIGQQLSLREQKVLATMVRRWRRAAGHYRYMREYWVQVHV